MIWVLFLVLNAGVGLYLLLPFAAPDTEENSAALEEARQQRAAIDLDAEAGRLTEQAAQEARDALDRRILALLNNKQAAPKAARIRSITLYLVPAVLLLGGVGIYTQVGQPRYEPITMADYQAQQAANLPQSLEGLVVELRMRLEADPNPPVDGYILLARSYLRLGQFEDGFAAYETAIELSGGATELIAERDRAAAMLEQRANRSQPDPEAMARIQAMSPEEQAAMIETMVTGLALRLEQAPDDLQGWLRLIRARIVLGQIDQAQVDLHTAQATFAGDAERLLALQPFADELAMLSEPSE
ncbi:MAG: c-type cytochrome biogenesis protein CcmI [Pseudomonadota bacterium]